MTFTVDGKECKPSSRLDCDLDHDGDTDAGDAQVILNYAVGALEEMDPQADLNADGMINTYDAYLLLNSLETSVFTVPAGETAHVTVQITLPDAGKEQLDAKYVHGGIY